MTNTNRQWRLASYPDGMPVESNWTLAEAPVPEPGPGEMLVRAIYLDVAPYMRGRISPQKNYAAGVSPGDVMLGGGIGEVMRSNCPDYKAGEIVVSDHSFGWQEHALLRPTNCRRVDPRLAPLPYWLDALGMNGMTAFFALYDATAARAGDTVLISAAAGSVGQIAGQLARLCGCRAVGITSSPQKAAWCREIGYEEIVNYRAESDLVAAVAKACPRGVDVFIDNTAGPIHDAVVQNLATRARIAIVGAVSLAGQFGKPDIGPRFHRQILIARATVRGFLVSDYQDRYPEARARMGEWVRSGALKSKFDIAKGLEETPGAFLRLLKSENLGKQLVQVGSEPA
ncbi:MAG TPA: NADP-dependent oxidoreductase [Burkholderiales bacterium]|nr:NADP-dependent oxidoreductase [Burkholderiales bacterium]